jgi:hypothetical protein
MSILFASLDQPLLDFKRGGLDESRIRYYMAHPDEIRGMVVYEVSDRHQARIVVNGYHRTEAARRLGWSELDVDLRLGIWQDVLMYRDLTERRLWEEEERDAERPTPTE